MVMAAQGSHRLIHAGEIERTGNRPRGRGVAGAERIGHGIGVMRDERTMDFIAARNIPLEICLTSELRTGALARQIGRPTAGYDQHPLPSFFRRGLPVTLSSDYPAMFETTVSDEYRHAHRMGLTPSELCEHSRRGQLPPFFPLPRRKARYVGQISFRRCSPGLGIMPAMKAHVWVMPKRTVLDPQGQAIQHALSSLGFSEVRDVP